jgi:hypothetical protein
MIVWGGGAVTGVTLNTGWRYDPAFDSWDADLDRHQHPSARSDHTAVWTGTEMIIWGGSVDSSSSSVSVREGGTIP